MTPAVVEQHLERAGFVKYADTRRPTARHWRFDPQGPRPRDFLQDYQAARIEVIVYPRGRCAPPSDNAEAIITYGRPGWSDYWRIIYGPKVPDAHVIIGIDGAIR